MITLNTISHDGITARKFFFKRNIIIKVTLVITVSIGASNHPTTIIKLLND